MFQNLTGWHALIILAVIVLLFGAAKLPALARSVGQSMRILKTEVADTAAPSNEQATSGTPEQREPSSPAPRDTSLPLSPHPTP
jgi:sec-independent protein translocase protein TatA